MALQCPKEDCGSLSISRENGIFRCDDCGLRFLISSPVSALRDLDELDRHNAPVIPS